MHRRSAWLSLSLLLLAGLSSRAQPPGGSPFDRFDANKDGKLTKDELPEGLRPRFEAIDTNKDGAITPEEERAFLASNNNRPAGRGGCSLPA